MARRGGNNLKTAFLFSGYAPAPYKESKKYVETNPFCKKWFDRASEYLGFSLLEKYKDAQLTDLIMQFAFFSMIFALNDELKSLKKVEPDYLLGPSYGGLAAAVFAESLTFEQALWSIKRVSELDGEFENIGKDNGFVCFYNYPLEKVKELVKYFKEKNEFFELSGITSSSPDVLAACGSKRALAEFKRFLRKERGIILYEQDPPMHSSKMTPLKQKYEQEIYGKLEFKPPKYPLISDIDGRIVDTAEEMAKTMVEGFDVPVRWDITMDRMEELGVKKVYVIGPRNIYAFVLKRRFETVVVNVETAVEGIKLD